MSELWKSREEDPGNYGKGPGNVLFRWGVYEYAEEPVDMDQKIVELLDLYGNETVVDIGMGDGSFLFTLRKTYSHSGRLIGVEPALEPELTVADMISDEDELDIEFVEAKAQNLPFETSSIDVITARFMLYELTEEELHEALSEFVRVLRPGGKCAVTTSGDNNKQRQRLFEKWIKDYMEISYGFDIEAPPRMNANFNSDRASMVLPQYFPGTPGRFFSQRGHIVLRTLSDAEALYQSLYSMQDQFDPIPPGAALTRAMDVVVKPVVEDEIKLLGRFKDTIERDLFIFVNDK